MFQLNRDVVFNNHGFKELWDSLTREEEVELIKGEMSYEVN